MSLALAAVPFVVVAAASFPLFAAGVLTGGVLVAVAGLTFRSDVIEPPTRATLRTDPVPDHG